METLQEKREAQKERFLKSAEFKGKIGEMMLEELLHTHEVVVREEEGERIRKHIREWDKHSLSEAEFAGHVRHYFDEILYPPCSKKH